MTDKYPGFVHAIQHPLNGFQFTNEASAPNVNPKPKFIYGHYVNYDNINLNKDGCIVYCAAGCGVVFNPKTREQKVFNKHNDDVEAIDIHPDGVTVATGECGKNDMVLVWNSQTLEIIQKLNTGAMFKGGGVLDLAFSPSGKYLAALGDNEVDSTIAVYDWKSGALVGHGKGNQGRVFSIEWADDDTFIICGINCLKYNNLTSGGLVQKNVSITPVGVMQTFYCCFFHENIGFVGTQDGSLYFYSNEKIVKKFHVADKPITSLRPDFKGNVWVGTKDGRLIKFQIKDWAILQEYNLGSGVLSLDLNEKDLLAETNDGRIIMLKLGDAKAQPDVVLRSHAGGSTEVWGLATVPGTDLVISAGDDKRVIVWDLVARKAIAVMKFKVDGLRCVAVNPDATEFAVGSNQGNVFIFGLQQFLKWSQTYNQKEAQETQFLIAQKKISPLGKVVNCIAFSPNGKYLAAGSADADVDFLSKAKNYEAIHTKAKEGHTCAVKTLDWSADSEHIRTTDATYEILFTDVKTNKRDFGESYLSSVDWATESHMIGWASRGIWTPGEYGDGTDINAADVDKNRKLIAIGDDKGYCKIFNWPTPIGASGVKCKGHSAHVTNVKFLPKQFGVVSAGGRDKTIIHWGL